MNFGHAFGANENPANAPRPRLDHPPALSPRRAPLLLPLLFLAARRLMVLVALSTKEKNHARLAATLSIATHNELIFRVAPTKQSSAHLFNRYTRATPLCGAGLAPICAKSQGSEVPSGFLR